MLSVVLFAINVARVRAHDYLKPLGLVAIVLIFVPVLLFLGSCLYCVCVKWRRCLRLGNWRLVRKLRCRRRGYVAIDGGSSDEGAYCDRVVNPQEYSASLSAGYPANPMLNCSSLKKETD